MRLDPQYPPYYLITLGGAEFALQQYEQAITTLRRAAARNRDTDIPLIYLASAHGHLGRIDEADLIIEDANDLRQRIGRNDVTLEPRPTGYTDTPFRDSVDFHRFGVPENQERLREGLKDLPLLNWQYLVDAFSSTSGATFEVDGATRIDAAEAYPLQQAGALIIDTSHPEAWAHKRIPGSVNLTYHRNTAARDSSFNKASLNRVAGPEDAIVISCGAIDRITCSGAWEAAKALTWGYTDVSFFRGGSFAWEQAGHPVETGS